jgi:predicted branched-subunit amino acid permease
LTAIVMSGLVWSGAGQFAASPLWPEGRGVVVLTTLAPSLRFMLITASIAPMLVDRQCWLLGALAYCMHHGRELRPGRYASRTRARAGYLFGSWIRYTAWLLGTVFGVLVGAQVPPARISPLKAVFPLVFLVLTALLCTSVPLALAV